MALPTDTRGKAGGGSYFKPEQGQNKVLIVGNAIAGYEYWTNESKVHRSPEKFTDTPDIRTRTVDGEEIADKQKFFWAVPVFNLKTEAVEVWQISQKGIRDSLAALQADEDWGDPTNKYTITVSKSGEGLETKYSVTPNPVKKETEEVIKQAKAEYDSNTPDLEAIFFGEA